MTLRVTDDIVRSLITAGVLDALGGFKASDSATQPTNYTIDPAAVASNTLFTNRGASGVVTFTLPAPDIVLTGVRYEFLDVEGFRITVVGDQGSITSHKVRAHCDGYLWILIDDGPISGRPDLPTIVRTGGTAPFPVLEVMLPRRILVDGVDVPLPDPAPATALVSLVQWPDDATAIEFSDLADIVELDAHTLPALQTLAFPQLRQVGGFANNGRCNFNGLAALTTLDLSNLRVIMGCTLQIGANVAGLPLLTSVDVSRLQVIDGNAGIAIGSYDVPLLTVFALPALQRANFIGVGNGGAMPALVSIDLSALLTNTDAIVIGNGAGGDLSALTSVDLSALQTAGTVGIGTDSADVSALATLLLPALVTSGIFTLAGAAVAALDLSALEEVDSLSITACAALAALDLSALVTNHGALTLGGLAITALDLSALVTSGAISVTTCAGLTSVTFAALKHVTGNVTVTGAALTEAAVDAILVRLAGLDGTAGTTSYDSKTVNLSGGTSAPPSATGLTAKGVLEGRSCTVTVNS